MLKPMLARGELHTIGATTLDEYRKHIEKDAALERRFQPVLVGEPTVEDTISILRGLRERYEIHHGVKFKDSALVAAAVLSQPLHHRPVPARQGHRPDRRGGVAAAHGDRLDAGRARRGRSAASCSSRSSARRCARRRTRRRRSGCEKLEKELADLKEEKNRLAAHWQQEKEAIQAVAQAEGGARAGPARDRARAARRRLREGVGAAVRPAAGARAADQGAGSAAGRPAAGPAHAQGGSRRGRHRRGRQPLDAHPGQPADGRRDPEAAQDGGTAAPARRRPGRSDRARSPTRSAAPAPGCRIRTGRSAASSSSARPASARPSSRARSPSSCSTTSTR